MEGYFGIVKPLAFNFYSLSSNAVTKNRIQQIIKWHNPIKYPNIKGLQLILALGTWNWQVGWRMEMTPTLTQFQWNPTDQKLDPIDQKLRTWNFCKILFQPKLCLNVNLNYIFRAFWETLEVLLWDLKGIVPSSFKVTTINHSYIIRSGRFEVSANKINNCWWSKPSRVVLESLTREFVLLNLWVGSQSHKLESLCCSKSKKRNLWIQSLHVIVLVNYYVR